MLAKELYQEVLSNVILKLSTNTEIELNPSTIERLHKVCFFNTH